MGKRAKDLPAPIEIGPLRASAMRRWDDRDRPYWRARLKGSKSRKSAWTGYGTRPEVFDELVALLAADPTLSQLHSAPVDVAPRTMDEAWAVYQERLDEQHAAGALSDSTLRNARCAWSHWKPVCGDVSLAVVERRHLLAGVRRLRDAGYADSTIWVYGLQITKFARWMTDREWVTNLDSRGLAKRPDDEAESVYNTRPAERWEITPILAAVGNDEVRAALWLQAVTGARSSEIGRLRRRDYNPRTGNLYIRKGKTKPRKFPLPELARAIVESRAGDSDEPMFHLGKWPNCTLYGHLRRACRALGVEPITPHGLRRMVDDALLESARVDPKTHMKLMGHSYETMIRRYRKPRQHHLESAVDAAGLGVFTEERGKVIELGTRAHRVGTGPDTTGHRTHPDTEETGE